VAAAIGIQATLGAVLLHDTLNDSKIYPGTSRDYAVSVPAAYDGKTPAALYVGLDGVLYRAPQVIDSLIATGDMPVTIGVYVQPGEIADSLGNAVRFNRSNEYDAIDSRMARFIEEELLPAVSRLRTPDGRRVKITDDPSARAISGASSGGIAAFVAAFTRPDLFRRVYTTCGTFVAMRGGDQLPALVRKTEPRPVKIMIHDGSRDAWNPLFGHWYEQNRLMASSLEFAGYDVATRWDDGTHNIAGGTALFPQAMKWLWEGYPEPVSAGHSANDMLAAVLLPGEDWTELSPTTSFIPASNEVYYPDGSTFVTAESPASRWLLSSVQLPDGTLTATQRFYLLHDTTFAGLGLAGLAFDTLGNLYAATASGLQVADQNGRVRAIIPWPVDASPSAFCFDGDEITVRLGDRVFTRRLATNAAPAHTIDVPSQGRG
jgi:enterochelin esterase-like enzyme